MSPPSTPNEVALSTADETSEMVSSKLVNEKALTYLLNFQAKRPLHEVILEAKELIHQIRESELKSGHKETEEMFCKLLDFLNKFDLQLDVVQHALQDKPEPNDIESLGIYQFHIESKEKIAKHMLSDLVECFNINQLSKIRDLLRGSKGKKVNKDLLNQLKMFVPKIEVLVRVFPLATLSNPSDIFSLKPGDSRLNDLSRFVTVKDIGSLEDLRKSYTKFLDQVYIGHGMILGAEKLQPYLGKSISKYLSGLYYVFNTKQAKVLTEMFIAEPQSCAFELWNLLDDPLVSVLFRLILPSIECSKTIEIDSHYPKITLQVLDRLLEENAWEKVGKTIFSKEDYAEINNSQDMKVRMRVVSPAPLYPIKQGDKPLFEELIIHIHGGGWVSGSSFSNQIITREWANKLGKPVFGLDYRLAPEHKYPGGLDDCWQAYNWLVDNAHTFGINPKKIILIGDSAGGNLALSLTLLLIKDKRRVPDGLMLPYPGLKLDDRCYTPSLLYAMDDPILSYSNLEMLLGLYLDDPTRGARDPVASPYLVNDDYLKLFPPIRIVVGSSDPLHDDNLRFVERLQKVNCNVHMTTYLHMAHGFLSFGLPGGMSESKICVEDCAKLIDELLRIEEVDTKINFKG